MAARIPLTRPRISQRGKDLVLEVLDSGQLTEGSVTRRFEEAVREYTGAACCLAATSCTTGLDMALRALGIGPGDEVAVPDYTYPATATVVRLLGASAALVDVDPRTMLVDYDALEAAITPATKAVMPVSLFGNPLDWDRLDHIRRRRGVFLIEDAACALGSSYKGRRTGALADITVFSLHPRKTVTTGEGGLVLTQNPELARWMDSYKHFGMDRTPAARRDTAFVRMGTNYKLSDILAAVGLSQMEELDDLLAERRGLARRYEMLLAGRPGVELPLTTPGGEHSYQSFCVLVDGRDLILDTLRAQGVEVQIGTYALHRQPAFRNDPLCRVAGSLDGSGQAFDRCLALPLYRGMTHGEQDEVVRALLAEVRS